MLLLSTLFLSIPQFSVKNLFIQLLYIDICVNRPDYINAAETLNMPVAPSRRAMYSCASS